MNKHLNIYNSYSKTNRDSNQLENDLTRALAVALQENKVFLFEFLKVILNNKKGVFENAFSDYTHKEAINIEIQKGVEHIDNYDYLFAVRVSGTPMTKDEFFKQEDGRKYNAVTDMFIQINNIAIIFEVKPDNENSTAQLYNQAMNTIKVQKYNMKEVVTPVDYNWGKIMETAIQVNNFLIASQSSSRILNDFIGFIKAHNSQWLPLKPLSTLLLSANDYQITNRLNDVIEQSDFTNINGRLGYKVNLGFAEEILLGFNYEKQTVIFSVYPGNTKGQGYHIFNKENEPKFKSQVQINGKEVNVNKSYHLKISSTFGNYITGLWANDADFDKPLYNKYNFYNFSGKKYREQWSDIESLFSETFVNEYDWRTESDWNEKILNSNRSVLNLSFGYEITFELPYTFLQNIDNNKNDFLGLIDLFKQVENEMKNLIS